MKLRHKLRQSRIMIGLVARSFAGWLRLCHATTKWSVEGEAELLAALEQGPVIIVLWHEHLMMGLMHWTRYGKPLMSLHDTSPIGRVAAAMEARFDLTPIPMSSKTSNLAMSRLIKRQVADGVSIGITGDGPEGPARLAKTAPLEWARATGVPVFVYANAMQRQKRLETWDKMILPLPFTRGGFAFQRWDKDVPRKVATEELEALRQDLDAHLNTVGRRATALIA